QMLVGCGVLIDLRQGSYRLTYRDIYGLLNELKPALRRLHHRIALISAPTIEQSDQLFMLSVCLADQGLEADVFYDIPRASEWLPHKRRAPVLNCQCRCASSHKTFFVSRLHLGALVSITWRPMSRQKFLAALYFLDSSKLWISKSNSSVGRTEVIT